MGVVWNPLGALAMAMGVVAFLFAVVIYFSRPWSWRNRWLALAFVGETWMFWIGLAWSVDDFESAYAGKQVWTALYLAVAPLYLLFASTLESPLARPLASPTGRRVLLAWALLAPAAVVAFPEVWMQGWSTSHWYAVLYALPGPGMRAYTPVIGLALIAVLVIAVSAWRRAPPGSASRRDMSLYLVAFAFRDVYTAVLALGYPVLRWRAEVLYSIGFIPVLLVAYGLLAYGMLRHQLFDVRLRARRLGSREGFEREREEVYRLAIEGLARADDAGRAEGLLSSLRRTLGISAAQHAEISASVAREDLRHRVERRGRFRVVRELGRGGHGRALLARDLDLERDVVLKEPLRLAAGGRGRDGFLAEARAVARISHPNVVTVHAILTDEEPPLLVLEHAAGGSLQDLLEREGALPPERVGRLGADVARGLERLHAEGLVHRDLNPRNVLLGPDGVAKVADFGVAARAGALGPMVGTPGFLAPEVERGAAPDARSDLWSLGATLHAALTGEPPAVHGTADGVLPQSVLRAPRREPPPSPVLDVVRGLLDPDPARRPADAAAAGAELEGAVRRFGEAGVPPRGQGGTGQGHRAVGG